MRPFILIGIVAVTMAAWPSTGAAQSCDTITVGVPVANADTVVTAYFCRGYGQVFLAADTLVHSISVWRPPTPAVDAQPRFLFITETDSLGEPDIYRLVLSGPSLVNQYGDGVNPVEYRFVFDPPFALPHRGKFFFDIQASELSSFFLPAVRNNPYPDGGAWWTGPVIYCQRPGPPFDYSATVDMCFQIQFCRAGAVPARSETWGSVKVHYR